MNLQLKELYNRGMLQAGEVILFPHLLLDQMLAHVLSDPGHETCGLLAGRSGEIDRVLPVPNAVHSPSAYRMDGPEFIAAMQACNFEPFGIYHSHIAGPPTPSATDIAEANYPETVYVIVSLHISPPSVRAFSISSGQVQEVGIKVD